MERYSVFDAHCDSLCVAADEHCGMDINKAMADYERMNKYKSYTQILACWTEPKYTDKAMERVLQLIDTYHENPCKYENVRRILSIEGGECITSEASVRILYRLGVRIAALTWNFSNKIAAGAKEPDESKGFTEFGKRILKEMNRIGMYLDVSHLNDKSFYDAAELLTMPIIATHSNSRTVCANKRNLTDDMFKIIIKSNGCTGINLFPPFLNETGEANIEDIMRHIEHFMSLGGENHVGIGADYDGVGSLPKGIRGCEDTYKIFDRLLQLNYTEEQVEKISHKNFERLFNGGE